MVSAADTQSTAGRAPRAGGRNVAPAPWPQSPCCSVFRDVRYREPEARITGNTGITHVLNNYRASVWFSPGGVRMCIVIPLGLYLDVVRLNRPKNHTICGTQNSLCGLKPHHLRHTKLVVRQAAQRLRLVAKKEIYDKTFHRLFYALLCRYIELHT